MSGGGHLLTLKTLLLKNYSLTKTCFVYSKEPSQTEGYMPHTFQASAGFMLSHLEIYLISGFNFKCLCNLKRGILGFVSGHFRHGKALSV